MATAEPAAAQAPPGAPRARSPDRTALSQVRLMFRLQGALFALMHLSWLPRYTGASTNAYVEYRAHVHARK